MGALLVYFVVGSIVAVPVIGYQLLRTRRELSQLRAELLQRGLISPLAAATGPAPGAAPEPPAVAPGQPAALGAAAPSATSRSAEFPEAVRRTERGA